MASERGLDLPLVVGRALILCNVESLVDDLWYWLDLGP